MEKTGASFTAWAWRHIAFELPSNWELLQFSTEFPRGRCAFADRYQFRAELNWSTVKGEPDYERMVANYVSKLEQEKKLDRSKRLKKSQWHGFSGDFAGQYTSRFGRYLPSLGCLVEWSFIWPDARDQDIESKVLGSCDVCDDGTNGQLWRAFGMEMRIPRGAAIEGCTVLPGRAECSFTDTRTRNSWRMGRLGMTDLWLKDPVDVWLRKEFEKNTRDIRTANRRIDGANAVTLEGALKPEGLHLRRKRLQAAAWINPRDRRLYHVRQITAKSATEPDVPFEALLAAAPEFTEVPLPS